jgi:2-(3-amino-3-carboxypropyl)histidine synthase
MNMDQNEIFPSFLVDMGSIVETISSKSYHRIMVQAPEGMKMYMTLLADIIEEATNAEVIIDGEPCYGACDHSGERAKMLGMDALIHIGHTDIPSMKREGSIPVHFFPAQMKTDMEAIKKGLDEILERTEARRVSLLTTAQHIARLIEIEAYLLEKEVTVHLGGPGKREMYPGQVLGCSFSAAKDLPDEVEVLIYIGTGNFHPLGLALSTGKEVHMLDPMTGSVSQVEMQEVDRLLRRRFAHIEKAKDALEKGSDVGLIIGSKPGQERSSLAESMMEELGKKGHKARKIVMDHIEPMKIRALGYEVAVNTACPRIAFDDSSRYDLEGVTLITPAELRIALDILPWDQYSFDEEW